MQVKRASELDVTKRIALVIYVMMFPYYEGTTIGE
jgi:hypothetical protein